MTVLPESECVAWRKMGMNGYCRGGVCKIVVMSPSEKRIASSMPKPRKPFNMMLVIIDRGTITAAFWISSDICREGKPVITSAQYVRN